MTNLAHCVAKKPIIMVGVFSLVTDVRLSRSRKIRVRSVLERQNIGPTTLIALAPREAQLQNQSFSAGPHSG